MYIEEQYYKGRRFVDYWKQYSPNGDTSYNVDSQWVIDKIDTVKNMIHVDAWYM